MNLLKCLSKITKNNKLKEIEELTTLEEIYNVLKREGYTGSYEEFEKEFSDMVLNATQILSEESLEEVSGGKMSKGFSKSTAAILSALTLSTSVVPSSYAGSKSIASKTKGTKVSSGTVYSNKPLYGLNSRYCPFSNAIKNVKNASEGLKELWKLIKEPGTVDIVGRISNEFIFYLLDLIDVFVALNNDPTQEMPSVAINLFLQEYLKKVATESKFSNIYNQIHTHLDDLREDIINSLQQQLNDANLTTCNLSAIINAIKLDFVKSASVTNSSPLTSATADPNANKNFSDQDKHIVIDISVLFKIANDKKQVDLEKSQKYLKDFIQAQEAMRQVDKDVADISNILANVKTPSDNTLQNDEQLTDDKTFRSDGNPALEETTQQTEEKDEPSTEENYNISDYIANFRQDLANYHNIYNDFGSLIVSLKKFKNEFIPSAYKLMGMIQTKKRKKNVSSPTQIDLCRKLANEIQLSKGINEIDTCLTSVHLSLISYDQSLNEMIKIIENHYEMGVKDENCYAKEQKFFDSTKPLYSSINDLVNDLNKLYTDLAGLYDSMPDEARSYFDTTFSKLKPSIDLNPLPKDEKGYATYKVYNKI